MKLERRLQFSVNKPLEYTISQFTDLQAYQNLHPLLYRVESVNHDQHKIYEEPFPWLPFFRISYYVKVEQNAHQVVYLFRSVPFTKVKFTYGFSPTSSQATEAKLLIQLDGLPIAIHVIIKMMIDAQNEIFSTLNQTQSK